MVTPYTVGGKKLHTRGSLLHDGKWILMVMPSVGGDVLLASGKLGVGGIPPINELALYGDTPEEVVALGRKFADVKRSYQEICAAKIEGWE